jgi:hypothetical protein
MSGYGTEIKRLYLAVAWAALVKEIRGKGRPYGYV